MQQDHTTIKVGNFDKHVYQLPLLFEHNQTFCELMHSQLLLEVADRFFIAYTWTRNNLSIPSDKISLKHTAKRFR